MKRLFFVFLFGVVPWLVASAQQTGGMQWRLGLGSGLGVGVYRDLGAAPVVYRGFELSPAVALEASDDKWRYDASITLCGGGYGYVLRPSALHTWGGQLAARFDVLRHFADWGPLRIWAGAGVGDMFDIRYNPLLANACVGMSNFAVLSLSARAEMNVRRWMFYGQMSVLPVALMLRPGFSYLNNYDREIANPLSAAFDQYHTYLTALPGVSTRLGVVRWLKNGNGISLSYDWHYLTSRVSGRENVAPWRMQQASHGLTLQLLFSL